MAIAAAPFAPKADGLAVLLVGLFCFALIAILCWRDLPIGRFLRRGLIEAPADYLNKARWSGILAKLLVLGVFVLALTLALHMEDGVVFMLMMPEVLAWMAAFDIATLLEIGIVVWFAVAAVRLRSVMMSARAFAARVVPFPRGFASARRRRHRVHSRPAANENESGDEEGPRLAFA